MCKLLFTAWTFGMMIPAGIFLPSITIGACIGRAVGLLTYVCLPVSGVLALDRT
jgi:chloride channel 3/4/5